jgi:glycosyltransferase involved in cell wall biosynthesis
MGLEKYADKRVCLTSSDNTGCGYYRTYLPYLYLKDKFVDCTHSWGFPAQDPANPGAINPLLINADVIWIQRANHEHFTELIPFLQAQGKKIIYDLDDCMWEIPASNLAHRYYPKKELQKLNAVVRCCDAITVTTVPLAEYMQKLFPDKKIVIIPNHLPHWDTTVKPKNEKIKIGWAGSYTHNGDFHHKLVDSMRDFAKKYKDTTEWYAFGFQPKYMKDFTTALPWSETTQFQADFAAQNWDIGVIVAQDNTFNRCKSNLKYLEYSQIKCVSIAHDTYPYTHTLTHKEDGLIVVNEKKEWREYLEWMITDEKARLTIATNAYEHVKEKFTFEYDGARLDALYLELFDYLYETN